MKNSKQAQNSQTRPLGKLIPSLVASIVIASLSASATANQAIAKLTTPAQVEQALTALLNARDANIEAASYSAQQSANTASKALVVQVPVLKADHSQKSVAELVLAGLAITSEAKYQLSSPATTTKTIAEPEKAQDYAVADIVTVDDLNSSLANAETELQENENPTIEAKISAEADLEVQALANTFEPAAAVRAEASSTETAIIVSDTTSFAPIEESTNAVNDINQPIVSDDISDENNRVEITEISENSNDSDIAEIEAVAELELEEPTYLAESTLQEEPLTSASIAMQSVPESMSTEEVESELPALPEPVKNNVNDVPDVAANDSIEPVETAVNEIATVKTEVAKTAITETAAIQPPVIENLNANVDITIRSEGCPLDFNKVSIPVNGKMCQIFAADFPASMILFIPQSPEEVIQYYLASADGFVAPKTIKKRTMLKTADNNTTLIISSDGAGTQVDILVKAPVS